MRIEFDAAKRTATLEARGLDMARAEEVLTGATLTVVGHPQELIISRHSSTDPVDDDAVAGRRHGWGLSGDGVCAAAG